ncbi:protein-glutamate O-methyltransferase CheR [Marinobacter sp. NFXS9]|uniref:CheR family methyltransferase n=1 Tax=Marinobacter sp. NFXS9 TaxID=2818433 RepID=UPI0032DE44D3
MTGMAPQVASPQLSDADFRVIQQMMEGASGIRLSAAKRYLVVNRLARRLRRYGLSRFRDYLERVRQDPDEHRIMVDLLTTNETWFFREPRHFEVLAQVARSHAGKLRVWSAASSSGEEAYSAAMTLAENRGSSSWEIVGTDISSSVLSMAREGIYPMRLADSIPSALLHRYCLKGIGQHDGDFCIKESLRQHINFQPLNLCEPTPMTLGQFDVVFLRNVLIYFEREKKQDIVSNVLSRMPVGGLLMIAHAESLFSYKLPVKAVAPSIYRKTA